MSKQGSLFLEQISRKGLGQNLRGSLVESSVGSCFFCMDHSSKSVLQVCVTGTEEQRNSSFLGMGEDLGYRRKPCTPQSWPFGVGAC